jgi:hypothetical protein
MNNVMTLSEYYSKVLGRHVGFRQTLHLVNVQVAFLIAVFVGMPIVMRLLCLAWLVGAAYMCRKTQN